MGVFETIGLALLAGFGGTLVMTASQLIEMRLTGRVSSFTPAEIVSKIFRIPFGALSRRAKVTLNYVSHFGYGTLLGILVPLVMLVTREPFSVAALNALIVWLQGLFVVTTLGGFPPPWKWEAKWILIDAFHHFVLGVGTAVLYFVVKGII